MFWLLPSQNVYYHMITWVCVTKTHTQSINGLVQNAKYHMRPNKNHNAAFFYEPVLAHAITKDREYSLRSDNANVFFKRKSNSLPYKATLAMILCSRMLQPTRSRLAFSRSRGHLARLQSGPALSHHWRNSQISNTPQLWAQSQQEPRLLSLHHQRTSTQPLPQKEFLLVVCVCVCVCACVERERSTQREK